MSIFFVTSLFLFEPAIIVLNENKETMTFLENEIKRKRIFFFVFSQKILLEREKTPNNSSLFAHKQKHHTHQTIMTSSYQIQTRSMKRKFGNDSSDSTSNQPSIVAEEKKVECVDAEVQTENDLYTQVPPSALDVTQRHICAVCTLMFTTPVSNKHIVNSSYLCYNKSFSTTNELGTTQSAHDIFTYRGNS